MSTTKSVILILILSTIIQSVTSIGIQASTHDFNITSPLDHGVYVCGQMLPITYVLLGDSSGLELNIYMRPLDVNATTAIIAEKADVSEDASSVVTINKETFWEHSYNYRIPQTAPSGNYEIVFESVDAGENTTIPITVRPFVSTSAAPSATGSSSSLSPSNSISTPSTSSSIYSQRKHSGVVFSLVGFISGFILFVL
ncbi:hypothetical protein BDA99DRAFT_508013 [Phascolomyces articulosus]|uniref:Uncharacterized protein n=1 Tax=Phascolomyces articulosus TaxID=60185 RepID=A0AAD5PGP0_9FUNG|nr:hypothetical protein BDA99DRAFT_508013 [Phascolomyces articulosus]